MSEHKGIGWMYDGVKADAHREDYLLGKTIDKNFEKYSDAVIVQKEGGYAVDALAKTRVVGTTSSITSKISSLPLNVMKSEDPLVAIKVKEESKRRDVLENPLTKLRFQKQMKEMMEKMSKKAAKKEKKRKRSRVSSDDDSSSDEKRKKIKKEKKHKKEREVSDDDRGRKEKKIKSHSPDFHDHRKRKDSDRDERISGSRDEKRSRREDSRRTVNRSGNSRERSGERRRRGDSHEETRKRRDSSGDERKRKDSNGKSRRDDTSPEYRSHKSSEKAEEKEEKRGFDSHIPAHLRPGSSSEDEGEKNVYDKAEKAAKAKFEGYGLVGVKKKEKSDEKDVKNPYELKRIPKFTVHEKSDRKRPLTEEEKKAKLKEMESNAKWRDDLRVANEGRTRLEDEKEEKEDDGRPASFVKPLLNSVADELSMEDRLKQRKKQLQRGHGYMDKL